MARLANELDYLDDSTVLRWACPVPFFGRITEARVATVGINPSDREFVDASGVELRGRDRRLPTLNSLSLENWSRATDKDVRAMTRACLEYFERRPYRGWFDVLDRMLTPAGFSYYRRRPAAHLDLVAYATSTKWGALTPVATERLIARGRRTLAEVIRESPVEVLVLNGRSVVTAFEHLSRAELSCTLEPSWTLPRKSRANVLGRKYSGVVTCLDGIDLKRRIWIIGFNHYLQRSGVPNSVISRIAQAVGEALSQAKGDIVS